MRTVVHWDRRRWSYAEDEEGDEETVEDEDDDGDLKKATDPGDCTKQKKSAQVMSHADREKRFAEREIELQNRRQEREQRKARYLKEAGGLKYTAIIMANKN